MVSLVAQQLNEFDDPPPLQFSKTVADIRTRHRESLGDVLGMERSGRQKEQSMDLRHRAVNAPARTHLSPMENELLLNWAELRHILLFLSILKLHYGGDYASEKGKEDIIRIGTVWHAFHKLQESTVQQSAKLQASKAPSDANSPDSAQRESNFLSLHRGAE